MNTSPTTEVPMLHVYCGTYLPNMRELGTIFMTQAEMSQIGYAQSVPHAGVTEVFTNSSDVFNGIRLAVKHGNIDHRRIEFVFVRPDLTRKSIGIGPDGDLLDCPRGFFDQAEHDLIRLLEV